MSSFPTVHSGATFPLTRYERPSSQFSRVWAFPTGHFHFPYVWRCVQRVCCTSSKYQSPIGYISNGFALSKCINVSHKAIYTAHYKVGISVMKKYIQQLFNSLGNVRLPFSRVSWY